MAFPKATFAGWARCFPTYTRMQYGLEVGQNGPECQVAGELAVKGTNPRLRKWINCEFPRRSHGLFRANKRRTLLRSLDQTMLAFSCTPAIGTSSRSCRLKLPKSEFIGHAKTLS
jgi:hypothetical protein